MTAQTYPIENVVLSARKDRKLIVKQTYAFERFLTGMYSHHLSKDKFKNVIQKLKEGKKAYFKIKSYTYVVEPKLPVVSKRYDYQ